MKGEALVVNDVLTKVGGPGSAYKVWRQNAGEVAALPLKWLPKLREMGLPAFRLILAPDGAADIVGIGPGGRFISVECKAKGEKPRTNQLAWGAMVKSRGGVWVPATSGEEALAALAREG